MPDVTPFVVTGNGEQWPPRDPTTIRPEGPESEFKLPSSPWTYENGALNPSLKPSSAGLRKTQKTKAKSIGASALPPYHPDYREGDYTPDQQDSSDDNDSEEDFHSGRVQVRRGSEGYEVLPQGREDMLKRYLDEIGEDHGKYIRYIPQVDSETEEEAEDIPLADIVGANK